MVSICITQTKVQAYCRVEGTVFDRQWKLHRLYFWWWINDKRCKINWTRNICIEYSVENVGNKQETHAECTPSLYLNSIKRDYIQITFSKTRVQRWNDKMMNTSPPACAIRFIIINLSQSKRILALDTEFFLVLIFRLYVHRSEFTYFLRWFFEC